ncbi:ATP-binding protein [Paenibacillus sp. LHD-117]|uniref:ATP-binding protein n=1 Tax=Paenibacillus sp. LHD-117 TaxID=3071412 RepID=UPI0027E149D7|nr:ATP-binding protein [Paenibacillus sp. LHD-117]MDQ6422654.1 ATP-binding protein [Paenibacillus sp. LHD-117]
MMPIMFMEDNRVFDISGNAYAVFRIPEHPYAFMPLVKKKEYITDTDVAFSSFVQDYHLYLLTKQKSAKQLQQQLQGLSKLTGWEEQSQFAVKKFEEEQPFDRINFICVPLKKRTVSKNTEEEFSDVVRQRMVNIWRGIKDVKDKFSKSDDVLPYDVLESSRRQSEELYNDTLSLFKGIAPATIHETEWWLKKGYYRGLSDPELMIPSPFPAQVIKKSGAMAIRPIRNTFLTISDKAVRERLHYMKIHHGLEEASYQTFYTVLKTPSEIDYRNPTGEEWIFHIAEKLKFPVDVAIHVRMESQEEAKPKVDRKNKIAKSQIREYQDSDSDAADEFNQTQVPEELTEEMSNVNSLRRKFREFRQPLMHSTTVFALGSDSYDGLKDRMSQFKEVARKHVIVVNPATDQKKMWQAFYPFGEKLPLQWELPMDPGVLAAAAPFAVRTLGDPIGFYLGKLLTGRVVMMKPDRPALELQRTGAILICGVMGSGKTVLMKSIMYHMLQLGAYGFTNDPKGDWAVFFEHPKIKKIGKIIKFTPGSDTVFTPLRLAATLEGCYEAAFGVLELILNHSNSELRNVIIGEILSKVYETDKWDMFTFEDVAQEMANNEISPLRKENLDLVISQLKQLRKHGTGRMIYGVDTGKHLFEGNRFICAVTRGLSIPGRSASRSEWSYNERLSVAMLYAVITLALRYLMTLPGDVLKALAWEEFWFLKRFERGRQLYNEALRLSRSEKMTPIMASQNPTDIESSDDDDDDVTGLFGWKFMLRLDSKKQVKYALHELMGLVDEDPEDWMNDFTSKYKDGAGLVSDPEGRIGEMQVEILDQNLMKYLKSTPPEGVVQYDKAAVEI